MILFEVKAARSREDVFGKKGKFKYSQIYKATLQSLTHLRMLDQELKLGFDWISKESFTKARNAKETNAKEKDLEDENSVERTWVQKSNWRALRACWVKLCVVFPNYTGDVLEENGFSNLAKENFGEGSSNVILITGKDVSSFSSQLESMLSSTDASESSPSVAPNADGMSSSRLLYEKVATWCLFHTFGLILSQRSKKIDIEHDNMLTTFVRAGAGELATTLQRKTPVALLTVRQRSILNYEHSGKKPVLIVGAAGTGKTFLLLAKIKQLQEENKLSKTAKALVIIHESQVCLRMFLKTSLTSLVKW
jgi:hypothetical protein